MSLLMLGLAGAWGLVVFWVALNIVQRRRGTSSVKPRLQTLVAVLMKLKTSQRLVLGALLAIVFGIQLALGLALAWLLVPWWSKRSAAGLRARAIETAMPEMVELLSVALHGGLGLEEAFRAVGERISGPLADELKLCMIQVDRGVRFDDALSDFRERTGGPYRGIVDAVLATQRYGLPLASTLDRLGAEAKAERRRQSEIRTRRLPVQMLFPLVLLFLPSVLLVVVVPVVGAALSQLTSVA